MDNLSILETSAASSSKQTQETSLESPVFQRSISATGSSSSEKWRSKSRSSPTLISGSSSSSSENWRSKSRSSSPLTSGSSSSENWRSKSRSSSTLTSGSSSSENWRSKSRSSSTLTSELTNQLTKKAAKVFHRGRVVTVNYEKKFGFLEGEGNDHGGVYFRVSPPGEAQLSSTLTGGMVLVPGDIMEYELAMNNSSPGKYRAHFTRLCKCKPRTVSALQVYVKSLRAAAMEHPDVVVRDVTKCPVGLKLVLQCRTPSAKLLRHTLKLCVSLSASRLAGLYRARLKQIYALFGGSSFFLSSDWKLFHESEDQLKTFLLHLLEQLPSQLPAVRPLLMRLGECQRESTTDGECFSESFLRKVLDVLGGGSYDTASGRVVQPWSQLALLPTAEEVTVADRRSHESLPTVKERGSYLSPEEYMDTYLRLLREDSVASLLQGIHALRKGKVDECDLKLWLHVCATGVHFNQNASPGLTFAVLLRSRAKKESSSKAVPLGGSLVCFFDDSGGFDAPIWGIVSRCEEDADETCVCFVDVVGDGTDSWSVQCARLMRGEDMAMAESPTYYKAYQPVLEALQLTNPDSIPFREELVFATWPEDPAPEYLKSSSAILNWSSIFENLPEDERHGSPEAIESFLERGYKSSFDKSQLMAVKLAVRNRLTIIQGPPGTGKTYIGVKLLQLLLSANTFPQGSPVFVITFKNHALDQFLEKCLDFCNEEGSIVRVGGRSKNRSLDEYNLQTKMIATADDEFRFDRAENVQSMKGIREELEAALMEVQRYLERFDAHMILANAPELHLQYFLHKAVPSAITDACASRLPEDVTLVDLVQGQYKNVELLSVAQDIKNRLVIEMQRWIPKPQVLQTAQMFLSPKKPSSSTTLLNSRIKDEPEVEQDASRTEDEERRSAYESLRQDVQLEADAEWTFKKTSYQWLANNFVSFLKKDSPAASVEYHRVNRDSMGSQFDWLAHENPFDLSPDHRAILVLKYWQASVDAACERLARIKAEYDTLLHDTEQIGERRKLAILQKAKIIGMTTTGAAIHQSVLKHLSPAVVLVEEAAEILEPQVLASLNANLQHLILIGDHHQLRPQVESYDLERWHGFGVSMFERLAEHNALPCQSLALQCRMREEFVPMLLPIYPYLESHTELVSGSRNEALECMETTMYFWTHEHSETSQRSYVNHGEAEMVVALARWIVSEVERPDCLTILAAYNGQVALIRKLLEKFHEMEPVKVRSIDSFQGDESEIVIVSLVRSNSGGSIGHLSMRNRLCVAASRARCGVYFVGNATTLIQKSVHWRTLIAFFEGKGVNGDSIPLRCPRHIDRPPFSLRDSTSFSPSQVCDYPCKHKLPCGHVCNLTCHYGDHHGRCDEPVRFEFFACGHSHTRKCCEEEEELSCKTKIMHRFERCGHAAEKECWEVKKKHLRCEVLCAKELKCGHLCKMRCSEKCGSVPCSDCLEIEKERERVKLQVRIKAIDSKQKWLDAEIQALKNKGDEGIVVKEVHPDDDTALSYFMAKDRAEKYIEPDSKTMVVVTKVEKIENLKLQEKFLRAQKDLIDPLPVSEWLFYGGSDEILERVVNEGFRATQKKAHLFHVYSSKIAENHDNHTFLLFEVQLGKTLRSSSLESVDKKMNETNLRDKGYDSLSLVGGQESEGELRSFAHIVFNLDQAIPRFLVSYELVKVEDLARDGDFERFGEEQASECGGAWRVSLKPSLNFERFSPEECHFRIAESQFFRMSQNRRLRVTEVEFIKNLLLEKKYNRKKEEFRTLNVAVDQRFVFHGTDANAIGKIATEGFKIGGQGVAIKSGASYGAGVYTAVNPDISVAYSRDSKMMLLSLAIPGEKGKHYREGQSAAVLVIDNVDQLLPRYVVHYS